MITIYEQKTGKPFTVEHMIDAKESVANGSYTFTAPVKEEPKPIVEPVVKKVKPAPIKKVEKPIVKGSIKSKSILKKK